MELPKDFRAAVLRHSAKLARGRDNAFILSDTLAPKPTWQIFEIPDRDVARATIRLRLSMRPVDGGTAMLALQRAPGTELAVIGRDGRLVHSAEGAVTSHSVEQGEDGWLKLDLVYGNKAPSIVLGLADRRNRSRYIGTGTPQIELKDLSVELVEPRWTPSESEPLRIVESGVETLLEPAWQPFAAGLNVAAFTPFAQQAETLRASMPASAGHLVTAKALSDRNGTSPFHVTENAACSSILRPDFPRLKGYPSAEGYQITSEARIETCRLDSLVKQGSCPKPDVIRLDAAGLEYNALRGAGDLLDHVLGVETALYLYPVYKKQKLMADVVDLLESSGLVLFRVFTPPRSNANFNRELVKLTGIFLRKRPATETLARSQLLEEIWSIPSSF